MKIQYGLAFLLSFLLSQHLYATRSVETVLSAGNMYYGCFFKNISKDSTQSQSVSVTYTTTGDLTMANVATMSPPGTMYFKCATTQKCITFTSASPSSTDTAKPV